MKQIVMVKLMSSQVRPACPARGALQPYLELKLRDGY